MNDVATSPAEELPAVPAEPLPAPGSLEERIAARRDRLESRKTEKFDIPGFDGVFRVEMRSIGWKQINQIRARHQRLEESQSAQRVAAEIIASATVGFHEIRGDEGASQPAEGRTWVTIARAVSPHLGPETSPRVAVTHVLGAMRSVFLSQQYLDWLQGDGSVDEELERDLPTTR